MRAGREHAGIIVRNRQRLAVGEQARRLAALCSALEQADLANRVIQLEEWLRQSS